MANTLYTAEVGAVPEFESQLAEVGRMLRASDGQSGASRFATLCAGLRDLTHLLSGNPYSTRSVQFAEVRAQAVVRRIAAVQEQAKALHLPNLKEAAVGPYVVLFAHSEKRVVLLALLHQDELAFVPGV